MNLRALRIVRLEGASHTIQLGVFPNVKKVRMSPYHTILIDIMVLGFRANPYHTIYVKAYGWSSIVKPS